MTKSPVPPIEYFASASQTSLEAFELARLDQIAALRAEIHQALEAWGLAEVDARLSRRLHTLNLLPPVQYLRITHHSTRHRLLVL
jgi:hypothetical protein